MRQTALQDFYVEYTLLVCLEQPASRAVTLDLLHGHIQDAFNEYGVQIMSPELRGRSRRSEGRAAREVVRHAGSPRGVVRVTQFTRSFMHKRIGRFTGAIGLAVAIAVPTLAQDKPFVERTPTAKAPLRFTAFAVQMQTGTAGNVDIVVERWSTPQEREGLIELVKTSTNKPGGQTKLLRALEDVKVRTGYIRTPKSLGWDLRYAYQFVLEDGSRQIVIATDKPVSFLGVASGSRTLDYPFSLVEMRFPKGSNTGEGKLLGQTSISTKDGRLQLELYGREATRLTTITEQ